MILGAFAVVVSSLMGVAAAGAGLAAACTPPGDGGAAGLTLKETSEGDFDGDGQMDEVRIYYDPAEDYMVHVEVTLANGYKTFIRSTEGVGQIATFLEIKDLDQDGDHEILVSIFPMAPHGPVELYAMAGCKLVRAEGTDRNGDPINLASGPGTLVLLGLDCRSPAAAGKGLTQYRSYADPTFSTYTVNRDEYRLEVNDAAESATLTVARSTETVLQVAKPAHQAMLDYASTINCEPAPKCDGKRVTIQGTPFKDKVVGSGKVDVVAASGGNDVITTKGKNDVVCAGNGNDRVTAGAGADRVFGQKGKDTMKGGKGADLLDGGAGVDTAIGGPGPDTCKAETKLSC